MSLYSTATDEELKSGLKWYQAKIAQLDRESTSANFSPEQASGWAGPVPERTHYFGGPVPEHLASMNTHEAHEAWLRAEALGAYGRGLLQAISEAMKTIDDIHHEQWLRSQQESDT